MATMRKTANQNVRLGSRRGQRREQKFPLPLILGVGLVVIVLVILLATWSFVAVTQEPRIKKKDRPIPELGNTHNTVAMDIIKTLECDTWFAQDTDIAQEASIRRRLQTDDIKMDDALKKGNMMKEEDNMMKERYMDPLRYDDFGGFDPWRGDWQVTGRELFCLVAGSSKFQQGFDKKNKEKLHCNAQGTRREALLDIWSSACTQMPPDMLKKVLDLSVETKVDLVGRSLNIWIPAKEQNLKFYSEQLNKADSSVRNITALEGPRGLFVDIGSGLGLSTLAVSLLYPQATVFSIEPAMPSWLLQRISIVCNLDPDAKLPHPIMSGVGAKADGMLKMSWSPSASEKSRAWTPQEERTKDDIQLTVRLRTLRSIMAEAAADADVTLSKMSIVLNLDCEGCEYNVVPAMADTEFNKIDAIIGTTGVHWGYIPKDKLPSSDRGRKTHERLCSHYDFARQSIECCDFPELVVKHKGSPTVSDLLGNLCLNFTKWANEKNLYMSTDDYGWTELSSMADGGV